MSITVESREISFGILAGGLSKRMEGADKLLLPFCGKTIIETIFETIGEPKNIYFCVRDDAGVLKIRNNVNGALKGNILCDEILDYGPIEGIKVLLKHAPGNKVFVLSGDMPLISKEFLGIVIEKYEEGVDALILSCDGKIYPTCGIYSKKILPVTEQIQKENIHKVTELLNRINYRPIEISDLGFDKKILTNVNTMDEYKGLS